VKNTKRVLIYVNIKLQKQKLVFKLTSAVPGQGEQLCRLFLTNKVMNTRSGTYICMFKAKKTKTSLPTQLLPIKENSLAAEAPL
jgi:hypothetical protein